MAVRKAVLLQLFKCPVAVFFFRLGKDLRQREPPVQRPVISVTFVRKFPEFSLLELAPLAEFFRVGAGQPCKNTRGTYAGE